MGEREAHLHAGARARARTQVDECRAAGTQTLGESLEFIKCQQKASWHKWPHLSVAGDAFCDVSVAYDMMGDLHCYTEAQPQGSAAALVAALEGPFRVHVALGVLERSGVLSYHPHLQGY